MRPEYLPWWELATVLSVASVVVLFLGRLAEQRLESAVWRRTIWQVAVTAMLTLLLVELTGLSHLPAAWLGHHRNAAASARQGDAPAQLPSAEHGHGDWANEPPQVNNAAAPPTQNNEYSQPSPLSGPSTAIVDSDSPVDGESLQDESSFAGDYAAFDFDLDLAAPLGDGDRDCQTEARSPRTPGRTDQGESSSHEARPSEECSVPTPAVLASSLAPEQPAVPASWPALVWLAGSLAIGLSMLSGYLLAASIRWRSQSMASSDLQQRVDDLARRIGVRRRVRLIESRRIRTPAAMGLIQPFIVIPAGFKEDFDPREQEAILVHELGHLAAADPAWQMATNLVAVLLWWQPAIWLLRRRLEFASEVAADEATLIVPAGPEHLAAGLVAMGRRLIERPQLGWLPMTGDGYRSNLGRRVRRLLQLKTGRRARPRRELVRWLRAGLVCLLVLTMVFGSAWFRPPAARAEGELTMTKLRISWSRSLAAAAVAVVFTPTLDKAAADEPQVSDPGQMLAAVAQDREEGHQPIVVLREEDAPRRDGDARREGDGDRDREHPEARERDGDREHPEARERDGDREHPEAREREGDREQAEAREREAAERREADRERAEAREREMQEAREREMAAHRERTLDELEGERNELTERVAHLRRELQGVPEGQEMELRRALEETMHAAQRVGQEMERVRHGDTPRPEGERREDPEAAVREIMQERQELMELGKALHQELEELQRAGKEDAAHGVARRLEEVKREYAELEARAKEIHGQINHPDQPRPAGPPREEIERRVEHLRVAAENLHAAGLHDQAEMVMQQAERLADEGRMPPREQPGPRPPEAPIQDLQRQLQQMRGQMEEMQRALRMLMERDR